MGKSGIDFVYYWKVKHLCFTHFLQVLSNGELKESSTTSHLHCLVIWDRIFACQFMGAAGGCHSCPVWRINMLRCWGWGVVFTFWDWFMEVYWRHLYQASLPIPLLTRTQLFSDWRSNLFDIRKIFGFSRRWEMVACGLTLTCISSSPAFHFDPGILSSLKIFVHSWVTWRLFTIMYIPSEPPDRTEGCFSKPTHNHGQYHIPSNTGALIQRRLLCSYFTKYRRAADAPPVVAALRRVAVWIIPDAAIHLIPHPAIGCNSLSPGDHLPWHIIRLRTNFWWQFKTSPLKDTPPTPGRRFTYLLEKCLGCGVLLNQNQQTNTWWFLSQSWVPLLQQPSRIC